MSLSTKIKEYREMQNLKQYDLAELVGVKLAMDIAKVYHATVEEVFSYGNISAR